MGIRMNMIHGGLAALRPVEPEAGQVFSGQKSGTLVKGYAAPASSTPAIDPGCIFHEASRDLVVWFLDPLCVSGPTGCGKTSCVKQLVPAPHPLAGPLESHADENAVPDALLAGRQGDLSPSATGPAGTGQADGRGRT